jgi:hypothetical protein
MSENRNLIPSVQGKEKKEDRPAGRAGQRKRPARAWLGESGIQRVVMREEKTNHKTEHEGNHG